MWSVAWTSSKLSESLHLYSLTYIALVFDCFQTGLQPTHQSIKKVASFFYGNGVPLRIANHLSTLCNPLWNHHTTIELYTLYHLWLAEVDTLHHAKYYNTGYRKMYWINGGNCPRDEPVTTDEISIELGFEGTTDGDRIIDRLNELSHEKFTFDLIP